MKTDFEPINCGKCGTVIWTGISWAGFARRLGTDRLTVEEELKVRLTGGMSYEVHRTRISFEAVERSANRIKWARPDRDRVILADHICSSMSLFQTTDNAPMYWGAPKKATVTEGCPF